MINERYRYSALTSRIIGCTTTVHQALGNGFQEVIYQRALKLEMDAQGIPSEREFEMPIYKMAETNNQSRRDDHMVETMTETNNQSRRDDHMVEITTGNEHQVP